MSMISDFRGRLRDIGKTAAEIDAALAAVEQAYARGLEPVPGLVLAQCYVQADEVAAKLARLGEWFGNSANPAALADTVTTNEKEILR